MTVHTLNGPVVVAKTLESMEASASVDEIVEKFREILERGPVVQVRVAAHSDKQLFTVYQVYLASEVPDGAELVKVVEPE